MADTATASRIRPDRADRVFYHAAVYLACTIHDDAETEDMLALARRCLPMLSNAPRLSLLRRAMEEIQIAAPQRRQREGAASWARAQILLSRALCSDAKAQAVGALE
jgi:hypothetical protein